MGYKRKTEDEYRLHVNYGQGWEHDISESTRRKAIDQQRSYRLNCPEYATKVTGPHRVNIELA